MLSLDPILAYQKGHHSLVKCPVESRLPLDRQIDTNHRLRGQRPIPRLCDGNRSVRAPLHFHCRSSIVADDRRTDWRRSHVDRLSDIAQRRTRNTCRNDALNLCAVGNLCPRAVTNLLRHRGQCARAVRSDICRLQILHGSEQRGVQSSEEDRNDRSTHHGLHQSEPSAPSLPRQPWQHEPSTSGTDRKRRLLRKHAGNRNRIKSRKKQRSCHFANANINDTNHPVCASRHKAELNNKKALEHRLRN